MSKLTPPIGLIMTGSRIGLAEAWVSTTRAEALPFELARRLAVARRLVVRAGQRIDPAHVRRIRDDVRIRIDPSAAPCPRNEHGRMLAQGFRHHRLRERGEHEGCGQ
jgi:hypothetical protein